MAKFTYSCENEGFVLDVDSTQRSYELKGPICQKGHISNNFMSLDVNAQLFCCSDAYGSSIILVDKKGYYEIFDFDTQGKPSHRFIPQTGAFGSSDSSVCNGKFLTLTCCDINSNTNAPGKELYVAMEENQQIYIYCYNSSGTSLVTTPFALYSAFDASNILELVDLSCCGSSLQVIAKDTDIKEYVSVAFNPTTSPAAVELGIFDPNLDYYSSTFVQSFCCPGDPETYFIIFNSNGQNVVYESSNTEQLGSTSSFGDTNAFDDLNGSISESRPIGDPGDQFITLSCCSFDTGVTDIVAVLKSPVGQFKLYILNPDGSETDINGVKFGLSNDSFVNVTCCGSKHEVFVTLRDATGNIKLFGFNNTSGLIAGDFTSGLKIDLVTCHADTNLPLDYVYIFQDDTRQNYIFITQPDGTPITCPQQIGSRNDHVERITCCAGETSSTYPYTVTSRVVLVILKDAATDQLYLHVLDTSNPSNTVQGYKYAIGYPGDQLVQIQCCDFISQPVVDTNNNNLNNNDILIVLKTAEGLHKIEIYNNANGGQEIYGHTNPKTFGLTGDEFFSLACCGGDSGARKLLFVLKSCSGYSLYSFVEAPTEAAIGAGSTNGNLVWKVFQEYLTDYFVKVCDQTITFVFNSALYTGYGQAIAGANPSQYPLDNLTLYAPLFFDVTKSVNVLFSLSTTGCVQLCPVVLPSGTIKSVKICDIDGNGLDETIIVIEDHKGRTRLCVLSNSGTMIAGFSGTQLGDACDEFVDMMCCDFDGDGKNELVFLMRHRETCTYYLYAYNIFGKKLFCRRVGEKGLRFVSLACCPVKGVGCSDIMLAFKDTDHTYSLFAYNIEGRRYYLFDLQYKVSDNDVMFRYNVGYNDCDFKIFKITKTGAVVYCPRVCDNRRHLPL